MTNDSHLTALLERAVDGLDSPTERLVRGGLQRGRRLRLRRRVIQGGSGVALIGLIAVVAVSLVPGGSPAAQRTPAGRPRATTGSSTVPATAHGAGTAVKESISPQLLAERTIKLLPQTAQISDLHGRSMAGDVLAEFVYDDGHGAAQINVSMGFRQDGGDGVDDSCNPSDPVYTETCRTTPDGSRIGTFVSTQGTAQNSVYIVRPDHVEVSMTAFNAPQEKDVAPTRPTPPFTLAQLTRFVSDPSWTPWVSPDENQSAANLFVPDYTYNATARRNQRRLEQRLATQARRAGRGTRAQRRAPQGRPLARVSSLGRYGAHPHRQGPRAVPDRRRPAGHGCERSDLGLRLRARPADPRQGAHPHRDVGVVVRPARRPRPESPDQHDDPAIPDAVARTRDRVP